MTFYRKGKKITKKEAIEWLGKEKFESRVEEAKRAHMEDPYEEQSWMDGFLIEF